jgi:hypothetical protein
MRARADAFRPVEARQNRVRCEEFDCTARHEKPSTVQEGRLSFDRFAAEVAASRLRESTLPVRQVGEGTSPILDAGLSIAGSYREAGLLRLRIRGILS